MKPLQNLDDSNSMNGSRILIIEDNNYVRDAFELTLERSGFDTLLVTTAEEAIEAVRQNSFDIIISDYRLPGMNGLDFFIIAKPFISRATRVLISAYGLESVATDAKIAGVDHLISKPFSIQKMLSSLKLVKVSNNNYCDSLGSNK